MNYILFDPPEIERFYPFTLTRPLGELRVFGGTLKELWEQHLGCTVSYLTRDYLSSLYPVVFKEKNILLNPLDILYAQNLNEVDKISKNLRCLICQGQSVYDSQSDFAKSMKSLIEKKIEEGKNEKQIYEFLKSKYGEWIVYDPEINKNTILLWLIPLILFVFGGLLIIKKASIK